MEAEKVFKQSLSKEVWYQTYKWETDKDVFDTFRRVARTLSETEKKEDRDIYENIYFGLLSEFKYVPGGRITSNAGTGLKGTTLVNCFVSGFQGENQDSIEGIFDELKRQAKILKSEGGYGFCANVLRPNGAYIKGIGSESPGSVAMLSLWDTVSKVITSGSSTRKNKGKGKNKIRKGAMMVTLGVNMPDIEEFIMAKTIPGQLTKFNMSVLISDDFMHAVKNNLPWNLEYPELDHLQYDKEWDGDLEKWKDKGYTTKIYKTYENANELWDMITKQTYTRNEPGILFIDRANKLSNIKNIRYQATNPCLTGDTLVMLADGRGYLSIRQLAEEGKDVPVFCYNNRGTLEVRYMREPRLTSYNQQIYKVTLDDGSVLRTTGNHKFLLTSGEYKEVKDFSSGESLSLLTKFEGSIKDIFPNANSNSSDYYWLKKGNNKLAVSEHRLIAEFYYNCKIPSGSVVHHKDYNSKNNAPENLEIMTKTNHTHLHSKNMIGLNNPMVRAQTEWSEEKWKQYSETMSKAISGENNGRAYGITNDQIKVHALELTKKLGHRFSQKEWKKYALEKKIPSQFSKWRNDAFDGQVGLSKWAASELGFECIDSDQRCFRRYKELLEQGYNCVLENNEIIFIKKCEHCKNKFKTKQRLTAYCSLTCSNLSRNNRSECLKTRVANHNDHINSLREKQVNKYLDMKFQHKKEPLLKEWATGCDKEGISSRLYKGTTFNNFVELKKYADEYNHRVVSVELDGFEDVFNGTVDEFHNFFISNGEITLSNKKKKFNNFNNLQCGEQFLLNGESCVIGSQNLVKYINKDKTDFDYESLAIDIPNFVRMQDSVIDVTQFPLENQKDMAQRFRRIGIGYLGYGSALYLLKLAYGSKEALEKTDKLCSFITNEIYKASALLAKEKGCFPAFNKEEFLQSNFLKQALTTETISYIEKYGIRNSFSTTCAPTGNSGIFANCVSGGLEPVISDLYIRTVIVPHAPEGLIVPKNISWDSSSCEGLGDWKWAKEGDESLLKTEFNGSIYKLDRSRGLLKEEPIYDYAVLEMGEEYWKDKEFSEKEGKEFYGKTIYNLGVDEHLNTLSVFAKYLDSSASKTINLPNDYPYEKFKDVYTRAFDTGFIKGVTTYRMGTMASVVSAKDDKSDKKTSLDRPKNVIVNHAPKRPKTLPCDVHQTQIKGEKWNVFIGKLDGYPFEVFAGKSTIKLPEKGTITKIKSKNYIFEAEGVTAINILDTYGEHGSYVYSKMLSHGTPIWSLVDMCDKMIENVLGFNKAMGRVIKKYIKETDAQFMKCGSCGSTDIIFQEGCILCRACGNSKCS